MNAEQKHSTTGAKGFAEAMKVSSEFIAGILVGGLLGWVIDYWAGTTPFGLVVFLLLGFVAGILNVLRATGKVSEAGKPYFDDKSEDKQT